MRTSRTFLAASFLAVVLVVALTAAASFAQAPSEELLTGEIKEKGVAQTLIVEEEGGKQHILATDDATKIMSGAKKIGYEDLKVGWWIAVDADARADVAMAITIEVVDAP